MPPKRPQSLRMHLDRGPESERRRNAFPELRSYQLFSSQSGEAFKSVLNMQFTNAHKLAAENAGKLGH